MENTINQSLKAIKATVEPYIGLLTWFTVPLGDCLERKKNYETQDLSSPNGKRKMLFYDYSWNSFFLQPIAEGNCEIHIVTTTLTR